MDTPRFSNKILFNIIKFINNPGILKLLESVLVNADENIKLYNKKNYKIFVGQFQCSLLPRNYSKIHICKEIKSMANDYRTHKCDNCDTFVRFLLAIKPKYYSGGFKYYNFKIDKKSIMKRCILCGDRNFICIKCKKHFIDDPLYSCNNCAYGMDTLEDDYNAYWRREDNW